MKVKIIYCNDFVKDEEFENVKQYTNANGNKKYLGLIMNGEKEIIYIDKEVIKRIEINKESKQ